MHATGAGGGGPEAEGALNPLSQRLRGGGGAKPHHFIRGKQGKINNKYREGGTKLV